MKALGQWNQAWNPFFELDLVVGGTLPQDFPAERRNADDLAEEVHHPLGPRQSAQGAVYDDTVESEAGSWTTAGQTQKPAPMLGPAMPTRLQQAPQSMLAWPSCAAIAPPPEAPQSLAASTE